MDDFELFRVYECTVLMAMCGYDGFERLEFMILIVMDTLFDYARFMINIVVFSLKILITIHHNRELSSNSGKRQNNLLWAAESNQNTQPP